MRTKINLKTVFSMIAFLLSFWVLMTMAFSNMCLTWSGTVVLIILITIAGYSATCLIDRYERIFE